MRLAAQSLYEAVVVVRLRGTPKATACGVGPETIRNSLNKYREGNGGTETDLTVTERARLNELEREVQELRAETASLKIAGAYFARKQRQ